MKYKLLICCALCANFHLWAQGVDTFRQVLSLQVEVRFATGDNLGNLYFVTPSNALEKYGPDGRLLARYTNNRLGSVSAVDASNPMKVLAWFSDFRTAVFLDRSLTPLGELNLIQAGYPEVRTVASATDGNLWLYDEVAFKLRKLSPDGMQLYESQDLSLLADGRLQITCLRDDGARILAADPAKGLLWFDTYAQFFKEIALPGISDFQLTNDMVVFLKDGALQRYNLLTFQDNPLKLPDEAATEVWLGAGQIFVKRDTALSIFAY